MHPGPCASWPQPGGTSSQLKPTCLARHGLRNTSLNLQAARAWARADLGSGFRVLTLMLLFRTTSAKELADIAESMDGEIDTQTFLSLCHAAWKQPHDFLFIDHHPKPEHTART